MESNIFYAIIVESLIYFFLQTSKNNCFIEIIGFFFSNLVNMLEA